MTDAVRDGEFVLIATPIGNLGDIAPRAAQALAAADVIAAEDTRRTRALLTHLGIAAAGRLRAVHAHNEAESAAAIVDDIRAGRTVVYVSDAGMPGISDPGERLVQACAAAELRVTVVPGPSAALMALVLSGLPTTPFRFEGFLARKGPERRAQLDAIASSTATTVVFESPRRVVATLGDLVVACGADRGAALARELTKLHEEVVRGTLSDLRDMIGARTEVKGECVLVVASAPEPDAVAIDDPIVAEALGRALGEGASSRDAAATVAARFGLSKRAVYELGLSIDRTRP